MHDARPLGVIIDDQCTKAHAPVHIEGAAVHDHAKPVIIDDDIEPFADLGAFDTVNGNITEISVGVACRAHGIGLAVRQCAGMGQDSILFKTLINVIRSDDSQHGPVAFPAKFNGQAQILQELLLIHGRAAGNIIPGGHQDRILVRIQLPQHGQIILAVAVAEHGHISIAGGDFLIFFPAFPDHDAEPSDPVLQQGDIHLTGPDAVVLQLQIDLLQLFALPAVDLQADAFVIALIIDHTVNGDRSGAGRFDIVRHFYENIFDAVFTEGQDRTAFFQAGQVDHELGFGCQFIFDKGQTIFFDQSIFIGEQVGAQAQTVSFDLRAQSGNGGREIIHRGILAYPVGFFRSNCGVDICRIDLAVIVLRNIDTVVHIHGGMVSGNNDGRIFVEILLLYPADELCYLPVRAGNDVGIAVISIFVRAQIAYISVFEMGIYGQNGQVERFFRRRQLRQGISGKGKQFLIFIPPPYIIIGRNPALFFGVGIIVNIITAMAGEIGLPAAEYSIGTQQEDVMITLILQDIAHVGDIREETVLAAHDIVIQSDFERKARSLGKNASHRPGGSGQGIAAVQLAAAAAEILIFFRELRQLVNDIVGKGAPVFFIRIGDLYGFQYNIDQIPFLFGEGDGRFIGIHIIVFDKSGAHGLGTDKTDHIQLYAGDDQQDDKSGKTGQKRTGQDPAIGRLTCVQAKKQADDSHDQKTGKERACQIFLDHTAACAGYAGRQLDDHFVHCQFAPGRQHPSGAAGKQKEQKRKEQG